MAVETNHELILTVVKKVLSEMIEEKTGQSEGPTGIFETVEQAVENAVAAQKRLLELTLSHRDKIIAAIRQAALDNNEKISALAVTESWLGRYQDKVRDRAGAAQRTPHQRYVVDQHLRMAGRRQPGDIDDVLDADRHAMQLPARPRSARRHDNDPAPHV
jgi:acyl-CoA reductase-like NAD-dependent aldehyde dehydrogenase